MNLLATLFGDQSWSMHADHLRNLEARAKAIGDLLKAGMSPTEMKDAAYNGGSTVEIEIDRDIATIELCGDLIARAPWYAKAYMGVLDPLDIADAFDDLVGNNAVTTVIIEADSCGGTVAGAQEIADALLRLRASGKQIEVRVVGTLASAAYWALCHADRIIATPTTLIGSLGVCVTLIDSSVMQASMGVTTTVVASSPDKVISCGNGGKVDQARITNAKRLVDGQAAIFFATVAAARGFNPAQAALVTSGQVWLAAQSLQLGLIDAVSSLADELDEPTSNEPAPDPIVPAVDAESPEARQNQTTTPAAAAATEQESTMDTKTQAALAALAKQHPPLAAQLVAAANEPNATPELLHALVATATLATKDAEIAQLKAALDSKSTSLNQEKAKADQALADAEKAKQFAKNAPADVGAGEAAIQIIPLEKASTLSRAEWAAMQAGKAKFAPATVPV